MTTNTPGERHETFRRFSAEDDEMFLRPNDLMKIHTNTENADSSLAHATLKGQDTSSSEVLKSIKLPKPFVV